LWFKNIPDHYWGVGYDNGLNTPKTDSTTAYDRLWWQLNPKFLFRMKKDLYLGPVLDFNQTIGKNESQGVLEDSVYQQFGPNNYNGGAGVVLQYDSRDVPVNAYRGTLVQVMGIFYGKYLGGNNNYQLIDVDIRHYRQVAKIDGQTFAWNLRGRFTTSQVPYGEMSQLGTPTDLRGYNWGRFRDKSMVYFIGEYRHMFMKRSTGERGMHGMVTWLAFGTIMNDVTQMDNLLPNIGVGYRLEVQPRMNVRFDFGIGRDNVGFYFNFTEAF
jgi:outer membrane protein assembly factor BamA